MLIIFLGLSYLQFLGAGIIIFKGITGFFILTFIPGFIILRILKLHDLDISKSLLLSIGLSLSYIMILGVALSIIYPKFGILKPLSFNPLFYTLFTSLIILLTIAYIRIQSLYQLK